jgi:hypothetical protein
MRETRGFLFSRNTGEKSNTFDFLPVLPEFLAILLPAMWTLRLGLPLLLKNEQQPINGQLFALVLFYYYCYFIVIIIIVFLIFVDCTVVTMCFAVHSLTPCSVFDY